MADRRQRFVSASMPVFLVYACCLLVATCNGQVENAEAEHSTRPPLTGIPQIDYVWDPNLPRELNGFNMSSYPFLPSLPEKMDFKCDGLHDGFYASIPHKCQVYHHCLFGVRYDFLCANYTAFDQKNFICHFASEVDCANSAKFYDRNEALYKAQSTTTSTTAAPEEFARPGRVRQNFPVRRRPGNRQGQRRRPVRPVYYDDYYDYDYAEYDVAGGEEEEQLAPLDETLPQEEVPTQKPAKVSAARPKAGPKGNRPSIFDEPRAPPRIRPPVPNTERKAKTMSTTTVAPEEPVDEFLDDSDNAGTVVEEVEPEPLTRKPAQKRPQTVPARRKAATTTPTTTTTTTEAVVEEEITAKPSRRPQSELFNSGARRPNVLVNKRLKTTTTAAPAEFIEEEPEEIVNEPVAAATRVPTAVTRQPFRPAAPEEETPVQEKTLRRPGARRGPQAAAQPIEKEPEQPPQPVRKGPGSRRGPQAPIAAEPVEEEPVQQQQPLRRRPAARQRPQFAPLPVDAVEEAGVEAEQVPVQQAVRKSPGFRQGPQGEQTRQQRQHVEVAGDEEAFEESQLDLSFLNLFSNARPRVS